MSIAPDGMRPVYRFFMLLLTATLVCYVVPIAQAQVCCTSPTSETSVATGPHGAGLIAEDYTMTVRDGAGDNFNGRTVYEVSLQSGTNTCWFSTNTIGMVNDPVVDGSAWAVSANNQYGPDTVGWTAAAVQYIRANGPAHGVSLPCTQTVYQQMRMICSGGDDAHYSTNVLSETIYVASEKSCRQGVCATINQ